MIIKKKICRPTDPKKFWHVTLNSGTFFLGLSRTEVFTYYQQMSATNMSTHAIIVGCIHPSKLSLESGHKLKTPGAGLHLAGHEIFF